MLQSVPEKLDCYIVDLSWTAENLERYHGGTVVIQSDVRLTDEPIRQRADKALDVATFGKHREVIDGPWDTMIIPMSGKLLENVSVPHPLKIFG